MYFQSLYNDGFNSPDKVHQRIFTFIGKLIIVFAFERHDTLNDSLDSIMHILDTNLHNNRVI